MTAGELAGMATELQLDSSTTTWPKASAEGFSRLAIPRRVPVKEKSWQRTWSVCYASGQPDACTLEVEVSRPAKPWQAEVQKGARLVEVAGRAGVLSDNGNRTAQILITDTAGGARVFLMGSVPASSNLIKFAEQLRPVAAGDPRIRPSAYH
jgi:hypothetical protein